MFRSQGLECNHCGEKYGFTDDSKNQIDLRLRRPKSSSVEFVVGELSGIERTQSFGYAELAANNMPEVAFDGVAVPSHMSRELMSHFPQAKNQSSYVLDVGCGDLPHREICKQAGFKYIGLDHKSRSALLLGDAHALPFKDNSIEFVLSIAVLEHLQFPFVAMKEVTRVLCPYGTIIGTVAFSEPFHGNSFYHHTHFGVYNILVSSGLTPLIIAPDRLWSSAVAHARMGNYGYLTSKALELVGALDRLEFRVRRFLKRDSRLWQMRSHTGVFTFIATKPMTKA